MATRRVIVALVAAPVVAGAVTLTTYLLTGTHRRLGASEDEARMVLPGDELLPHADVQNDRACTIQAPPAAVWPWIAQLGQDKAGFYSFEVLENLAGCQITGATSIHPEWQKVEPGDHFRLHPEVALRVTQVEPGHYLVVSSQGGDAPGDMDFETTWTFHLSPLDQAAGESATRLRLRERYATPNKQAWVMIQVTSVISAIMTWRMMSRLRNLATDERVSV